MKNLLRSGINLIIPLLLFVSANFSPIDILHAQTPTDSIRDISTNQITGQVLRVEENRLTLQTTEETKEVTVPEGVRVTKNSDSVNLSDIEPNDLVMVTQNNNGEVLAVDAVSGAVIDFGKWVIPGLVGGLILLLLIIWLIRRSGKQYFKTTVTKVEE